MARKAETPHTTPAPGDLVIVQDLLNTRPSAAATDALAGPDAAAEWLIRHGLLGRNTELDEPGLKRIVEVREALRTLVLANAAGKPAGPAARLLDQTAREAPMRVRFAADGSTRAEPSADGAGEAVAWICHIVAGAQADGHWQRLKPCANPECRRIFFESRKTNKWCGGRCSGRSRSKTWRRRAGKAPRTRRAE